MRLKPRLYALLEAVQGWVGRRDPLLPPWHLIENVGGGGYHAYRRIGGEFLGYFTRLGGLQPDERVLDVGCGCGRMAVPLLGYLSDRGSYWGFDIVPEGVRWCEGHVATRRRNFHFSLAPVHNRHYNRGGTVAAKEYRFPFEDDFFDFVFLTSVFTHMQAPEMDHYLSEVARVLKPRGRCLASYFLLNAESRDLMAGGSSALDFEHELPDCYAAQAEHPEAAVAFEEAYVRDRFRARGLAITEPIHLGSWCGRKRFVSFQDLVLGTKM